MFLLLPAVIVALVILYLLVIALVPGFSVPEQPLEPDRPAARRRKSLRLRGRRDVCFPVEGTLVRAWLYLPADRLAPRPCLVMGPPLGATRETGMEPFAVHFLRSGFAVLLFDYRHFGASDGEPRQLAWIPAQLRDWAAAVAYVRGLKEVAPGRIGLWGSSLSAGHALVTAAREEGIRCVCAQCPLLDGAAAALGALKRFGIRPALRLLPHGQRDLVRSWLGLSPHKIPIFGQPGSIAVLPDTGAWEAIRRLAPPDFVNEICARIVIRLDKYRPIRHLPRVRCPVLLQMTNDEISLPGNHVQRVRKSLGVLAKVVHYPIGHFDFYWGHYFKRSVDDQVAFFTKHLIQS